MATLLERVNLCFILIVNSKNVIFFLLVISCVKVSDNSVVNSVNSESTSENEKEGLEALILKNIAMIRGDHIEQSTFDRILIQTVNIIFL